MTDCQGCGTELPPMKYQGNPRKWCSRACSDRAKRASGQRVVPSRAVVRKCAGCDHVAAFRSAYCTAECRVAHGPRRPRPCPQCGDEFTPRAARSQFCSKACSGRFNALHKGRWPNGADPLKELRKVANRRGRMLATEFERIDPRVVFDRDDWTCHLCGVRVSKDVPMYAETFATLDHVVPLSRGGAHTYANIATACFPCNTRKGNRLDLAG